MIRHQTEDLKASFRFHQEALLSFEAGYVEKARSAFKESFAVINRLLRDDRRWRDTNFFYGKGSPVLQKSNFAPHFADISLHLSMGDDGEKGQWDSAVHATTTASSSPELPLFTQLLQLPKHQVTVNQFVFVTLYNLALTTHIAALSNKTDVAAKKTLMERAAKKWQLAFSLQWREGLNLRPVQALAILLNLAHALCLTGNDDGSKTCYRNILSLVHVLDSRNTRVPNKAFFLYNSFRMLGSGSSTSAPAA